MPLIQKLNDPQFWIKKCLTDLYFLCRCVLTTLEDPTPGYKDLYKPTHQRICKFIQEYALPGNKVIILCPRGWIKSYLITIGWTIQRMLQNLVEKKRDHWIISNATFGNAQQFLKKIKYNFQYNEFLKGLFRDVLPSEPDTEADRWTMDEIELSGNSVEVGSVEGNLVSRHYRGMINDDLVNLDNSKTVEQIIKVIDWWKLAQSLLEADGLEIMLGTRWSYNDLYGYLIDKFLEIPSKTLDDSRSQPVFEWHNGRYHYLRYLCWEDPVNETGSTFPTLFPERRLKQIKEEQAEHFPGQYLNDPMSLSDMVFQRTWFKTWRADRIPEQRVTIQLLDPAGKETKQSDFNGQVVLWAASDQNLYVRSAQRKKGTDLEIVEWMVETAVINQSQIIGVEEYRCMTFRDLATFLIPQMIRQGKVPKHLIEYANRIPYRMVELKHHNRPKPLRIKNLTGWFEQGKVFLAPTGMDDLIEELIRAGKTERDDLADALAYVLDVVIFPAVTDPPQTLIVPDYLKMTAEEKEKKEWDEQSEAVYVGQNYIEDDDSLF